MITKLCASEGVKAVRRVSLLPLPSECENMNPAAARVPVLEVG